MMEGSAVEKDVEVVSIGGLIYDFMAFMSKFPEAEEKINSQKYMEYGVAGVAVDCITQVSRLGYRCGHIGKLGDDTFSVKVKAQMEAEKIDPSHCIQVPGGRMALAWVMVKSQDGERCHVIHPMEGGDLTHDELEAQKEYYLRAKAVHMETLQMPIDPLYAVAKNCRAAGVVTSMDMDIAPRFLYEYGYTTPELLVKTAGQIDLLKICSDAVADLTDEKDLGAATLDIYGKLNPKVLILTVGARGCYIVHKLGGTVESMFIPAFQAENIVDTTGCGDAFQGGLIYSYLKGHTLEECGKIANACGLLAAGDIGARSSVGHETLGAFLKKHGVLLK